MLHIKNRTLKEFIVIFTVVLFIIVIAMWIEMQRKTEELKYMINTLKWKQ